MRSGPLSIERSLQAPLPSLYYSSLLSETRFRTGWPRRGLALWSIGSPSRTSSTGADRQKTGDTSYPLLPGEGSDRFLPRTLEDLRFARARARTDTRYGTRLYFRIRRPRPRPPAEGGLPARVICPFVRRHLKREISSVYGAPSLRSTDGRTPLLGGGNVLIERSRN